MIYKGIEFTYEIFTNDVKEKEQRYFKIKLTGQSDDIIPEFIELLKIIREQVYRAEASVNTLWDDLSNHYSVKAYPEINRIENLMRKLITTFMLTNIGINWTNETVPSEVKSSLKRKGKGEFENANWLHETDFIQLADFLFKSYSTLDINNFFKELKSCTHITQLSLKTIKEYVPRSNWERYFKTYVNCEDDYLNKKWSRLYELRCIIAHNNLLSRMQYDEIVLLVNELEITITEAINNVDKISIPQEEQEQIIENVISIDERNMPFIKAWKEIEKEITDLFNRVGLKTESEKRSLKTKVKQLVDKGVLPLDFLTDLDSIGKFRNTLADMSENVDPGEILKMTAQIEDFYNRRVFLESPFY